VLLLNNVPAPYFEPLFETLGRESGWRLTVCYASTWNAGIGWEEKSIAGSVAHRTIVLDQLSAGLRRWFGSWAAAAASLGGILLRERPEYLICYGYTLWPQMTLLLYAMATATPFAAIGDANYFNETRGGLKQWIKRAWLRRVARRASALIAVGTASRLFWESHGARPEQLFEARFAVDNDFFARECERRKEDAARLRTRFGLDGKVVFLFVGRLIERKNVDLIIRAIRQTEDQRAALVIAGAGEERAALEALARGESRVVFAGAVAPEQLPAYYAMADALVLPASREPWGLVVNEAMASGLAVIAHRHCGAALDLIGEDNGVLLDGFEVAELAAAMRSMLNDEARMRSMKYNSREKIKNWSIQGAACAMIRAVEESAVPQTLIET
jgi:glycosyltransferase involved in cell wall biosynthesis